MLKAFAKFVTRCSPALLAIGMILFGSISAPTLAQETTPEGTIQVLGAPQNPGANIVWPLPVSELGDVATVIGSANVPNMSYYYLEYLPLSDDLSFPPGAPWLPATVAKNEPVDNGVLATLDTNNVTDGLYAIRLVVSLADGTTLTDTVAPIRVNNARYHSEINRLIRLALIAAGVEPTPEPVPSAVPTLAPSSSPVVTPLPGNGAVNVRTCDVIDNYRCPIIGYLQAGQTADVIGISSNGSGWYLVRLPSGLTGWVSPTVVSVQGDMSGVPAVAPPAPLPPLPPPSSATITLNGISIQGTPTCGVPFNVNVNVANTGNATSEPGSVTLQDVSLTTGETTFTGYGSYPAINAGSNYVSVIPVQTWVYYSQTHELRAYVGSQTIAIQYTLAQGTCNVAATLTPTPTGSPTEPVATASPAAPTATTAAPTATTAAPTATTAAPTATTVAPTATTAAPTATTVAPTATTVAPTATTAA